MVDGYLTSTSPNGNDVFELEHGFLAGVFERYTHEEIAERCRRLDELYAQVTGAISRGDDGAVSRSARALEKASLEFFGMKPSQLMAHLLPRGRA